MLRRPSPRTLACLLACGLTWSLGAQAQKISDDVVRIGVLSDMSGLYVDTAGRGSVEAAKRALEDFGGQVLGKKVEIVWADHQNKADVGATHARTWFDRDGVDLIVNLNNTAVAIVVNNLAREKNKLAITATQMMESMILAPTPTRAEVSDVANAVLDGTDAVMLSAETAAGNYPVHTVEAMARICLAAEKSMQITLDREFLNRNFTRIDQSIAMSALFAAYHLNVKAVVAFTSSGSTALWMSRLNCGIPIFALTQEPATYTKMSLYRETFPLLMKEMHHDRDVMRYDAEQSLIEAGVVKKGDLIVLCYGDKRGHTGGTNTMTIVRVGEQRLPSA